jgi:hypothetical protein
MKKKSARDIPDFSRQPTRMASGGGHGTAPQQPGAKPARPTPAPAPKPQATSSKSGRRGQ